MKRFYALVLVVALLVSAMSLTAGAAYLDDANHFTADDAANTGPAGTAKTDDHTEGSTIATAEIPVKFTMGGGGKTTNVYAISYDASELVFTYGAGTSYIWNPEKLKYEVVGNGPTDWTSDNSTITVKNYSDLPVDVEPSFAKDSGVTETVNATFTPNASGDNGSTAGQTLKLNAAVATGNTTATGTVRTGTIGVAFSGALTTPYAADSALGTITLTVKVPTP